MGTKHVLQVDDDLELLKIMMEDMKRAPKLYQPTNYWLNYEKIFLPELRSLGLRDFRRRRNSVLSSFGATDLLPINRHLDSLPIWKKAFRIRIMNLLLSTKIRIIEKYLNYISKAVSGVGIQEVRLLSYQLAKAWGEKNGAKPIAELDASAVGNPEDIFLIEGKNYTTSILYYYLQYAYCCQYADFNSIDTIMEIGSGVGKQIEVIRKLHPKICFYIFDIPPQLYVCEQYLSALFPKSIVSYRKTRKMTNIPEDRKGKIFIFGNGKLPELNNLNYDLFWNSASFQEMEPDVVFNYLKFINRQTNKYIFLHEWMEGKNQAAAKGVPGVLEPTTLSHYEKGLKDFQRQDLSASIILTHLTAPYKFSFWKRNKSCA
jgi:putative sugar O-methyltransferase